MEITIDAEEIYFHSIYTTTCYLCNGTGKDRFDGLPCYNCRDGKAIIRLAIAEALRELQKEVESLKTEIAILKSKEGGQ